MEPLTETPFQASSIRKKIKGTIKQNWGFPLIGGFIVLLLIAAVSLSVGFTPLAEAIAVYAYYALAAGVILQLASYLKNKDKNNGGA